MITIVKEYYYNKIAIFHLFCHVLVSFEQVFDTQTKQEEVFDVVARPVIDKLATLSLCRILLLSSPITVLFSYSALCCKSYNK